MILDNGDDEKNINYISDIKKELSEQIIPKIIHEIRKNLIHRYTLNVDDTKNKIELSIEGREINNFIKFDWKFDGSEHTLLAHCFAKGFNSNTSYRHFDEETQLYDYKDEDAIKIAVFHDTLEVYVDFIDELIHDSDFSKEDFYTVLDRMRKIVWIHCNMAFSYDKQEKLIAMVKRFEPLSYDSSKSDEESEWEDE